jgi:hypothetical protein
MRVTLLSRLVSAALIVPAIWVIVWWHVGVTGPVGSQPDFTAALERRELLKVFLPSQ